MIKIDNFKIHFSNILSDKYKLNKEEINEYWKNKEKQEKFEKRRKKGILLGFGKLITAILFLNFNEVKESNFVIPVFVLAGIGALTIKFSVVRKNPYNLKEYRELDSEYEMEKTKFR